VNSRRWSTYTEIFTEPISKNIKWQDLINMLIAIGTDVDEGREGSRVKISSKGKNVTPHKPHPGKEVSIYNIKKIRNFLNTCIPLSVSATH